MRAITHVVKMGAFKKILWVVTIASILALLPVVFKQSFPELILEGIFAVVGAFLVYLAEENRVLAIVLVIVYLVTLICCVALTEVGRGILEF